jgi:Family of unknown function (DUF5677)
MLRTLANVWLSWKLNAMDDIRGQLERWSQSLCPDVGVGGLLARSEAAHKWKAPFRSIVIREALLWRMHDIGQQILLLSQHQHILGARILLRSAIETLALLIYLNQKTSSVISGTLSFFEFDDITKKLLMGSKNEATSQAAVNILTVLCKAEKSHPGLLSMHQRLSESAHPNYDGVLYGYSSTDPEKYETHFQNRWVELFEPEQEPATTFVFAVFEQEYNSTWHQLMTVLETWLEKNDAALEQQRSGI